MIGGAALASVAIVSGCGGSSGGDDLANQRGGGYAWQLPSNGGAGPGNGDPVPFLPPTEPTPTPSPTLTPDPPVTLESISVSPDPVVLYRGQEQAITVDGVLSDSTPVQLTGDPDADITITSTPAGAFAISPAGVLTPLLRTDGTLNVTVSTPEGTLSETVPFEIRRRAFVTHFGDDTLRAVDAETYAAVETLTLGGHPLAMSVDPNTDKLWVGVGDGQGIDVFDLVDLNEAPTETGVALAGFAYVDSLFNPFNNTMLWSHPPLTGTTGTLEGYEADTLAPMTGSPQPAPSIRSLALDTTENLVLDILADQTGAGLEIRDPDNLALQNTVLTSVAFDDRPQGLVYDPANQCAYVTSAFLLTPPFDGRIITIDLSTAPTISATTPLTLPRGGSMAIVGNRVFVSHLLNSAVSVWETTSASTPLTFVTTLPTGANPATLTVDPVLNRLLVSAQGADSLNVFDLTTLDPIAGSPFAVGDGPADVAFEP